MDSSSGYYDSNTGTIYPVSTSTWSGLSGKTWDSWKEWAYNVSNQIIWVTAPMFMGNNPSNSNLKITCDSTGNVSYKVYTSETGIFNGEEVETVISHNAVSVPAFKAKYIQVVVYSEGVNNITPTISQITVETINLRNSEIIINDLDSSTCDGSQTARVIPMPTNIGTITDMKITPHETASPYNLDVYVTNTPTSTYLIPKIISKDPITPTFALVGVDNHPRDGIVDIVLKVLPASYMDGNNLIVG